MVSISLLCTFMSNKPNQKIKAGPVVEQTYVKSSILLFCSIKNIFLEEVVIRTYKKIYLIFSIEHIY